MEGIDTANLLMEQIQLQFFQDKNLSNRGVFGLDIIERLCRHLVVALQETTRND